MKNKLLIFKTVAIIFAATGALASVTSTLSTTNAHVRYKIGAAATTCKTCNLLCALTATGVPCTIQIRSIDNEVLAASYLAWTHACTPITMRKTATAEGICTLPEGAVLK